MYSRIYSRSESDSQKRSATPSGCCDQMCALSGIERKTSFRSVHLLTGFGERIPREERVRQPISGFHACIDKIFGDRGVCCFLSLNICSLGLGDPCFRIRNRGRVGDGHPSAIRRHRRVDVVLDIVVLAQFRNERRSIPLFLALSRVTCGCLFSAESTADSHYCSSSSRSTVSSTVT